MSDYTEGERAVYGFLQYRPKYVGEDHANYDKDPWMSQTEDIDPINDNDEWLWTNGS